MKRPAIGSLLLAAVATAIVLPARPGAQASPDATISVDTTAAHTPNL